MMFIEIKSSYWYYSYQDNIASIVVIGNVLLSAFLVFASVIDDGKPHDERIVSPATIWMFIIVIYFVLYFVVLWYKKAKTKRALKRLDNENYSETVSARTALNDHIIGLINGHPAVIGAVHITRLLEKYPNDIDLSVFAARTCLFLRNADPPSINLDNDFFPVWRLFIENITSIITRNSPEQLDLDKEQCEKLTKSFSRMIQSMISVEQLLLDENMASINTAICEFAYYRDKALKRLSQFIQGDNDVQDKQFFFDLFTSILPSHSDIPELRELMCNRHDFVEEAMGFFPGHLKIAISRPELFQSYTSYTTKLVTDSVVERAKQIEEENENQAGESKGLMFFKASRLLITFLAFLFILSPVVSMLLDVTTAKEMILKNNNIDFGQDVAMRMLDVLFFQTPYRLWPNQTTSEFWIEHPYETFPNEFADLMLRLQSLIGDFTTGLPSVEVTEHERTTEFQGVLSTVDYYDFMGGNFTLAYALQTSTLISNTFVFSDYVLLHDDNGTDEYFYSFMNHTFHVAQNVIEFSRRERVQDFPNSFLLYIFVAMMVIGFALLSFILYTEEKRISLFLESLRETSKSEMVRSRKFLTDLDANIGKVRTLRKNHMKQPWTYYPLIAFAIAALALITTHGVIVGCISKTIGSHVKYQDIATDVCVDVERGMLDSIINQGNGFFDINITGLITVRSNGICPTCNLLDVMATKSSIIYGTNHENITTSIPTIISLFMSDLSLRYVEGIDIIHKYFSQVKPALDYMRKAVIDKNSQHSENLNNIILGTAITFTIIAFAFVIFTFIQILIIWRPAFNAIEALSILPYGSIPKDAFDIMSEGAFKILSRRFVFNHAYYDNIFEAIPDAVLVIGRSASIITGNKSAKETFFSHRKMKTMMPIDQISQRFIVTETGEKLSDYVRAFIFDAGFTPIVTDVECECGKGAKRYYQLSIVPLFEEINKTFLKSGTAAYFAVILRDLSDEVHQRQLAEEETQKHMQIIQSILPPEIATTIINERRSISFDVNVCAISFCDIVSFTPWCAANTAEDVVKTLSLMFTYFDERRALHPAVTKIKCIGDCYMAASGILGDVENAWTDMMLFCLDLIDAIKGVNANTGMNLQVRVGAAMGGPISAGVLGLEKPHFDIWGALVNDAQGMESGGRAMMVHINAMLYERVKHLRLNFMPSPDGTYLVTREPQHD